MQKTISFILTFNIISLADFDRKFQLSVGNVLVSLDGSDEENLL